MVGHQGRGAGAVVIAVVVGGGVVDGVVGEGDVVLGG